jgi:heme A synthase
LSSTKKYSIFIRVVCGILGVLGGVAVIFNALNAEQFVFEFRLLAIAFGLFIFIYVAIVGSNPLDKLSEHRR